MSSTRVLRHSSAVAFVILLVSGGCAGTDEAVCCHGDGRVEPFDRSAGPLASPAVVQIFTTAYVPAEGVVARASDLVTTQRASGSDVIVDPDGYIVTNAHVVIGAQRLHVDIPLTVTGDSILAARSRTVEAAIVGIDSKRISR